MPNSLLYLLATLIWGSTWLAITFQLGQVAASASVAYRFLLAGSLLMLWCIWRGEKVRLPFAQLRWMMAQGLLMFGAAYILVYLSEQYISSGLVAVLNASMVAFNLIGARLVFGKRIDAKSSLGATLGIIGVALVFWPELYKDQGLHALLGCGLSLGAALLASTSNLIAQRNKNHALPLWPTMAWGMLSGGSLALVWTLISGQQLGFLFEPGYILSLLYLSVFGSIIAFGCYLTLLGRIGSVRSGYIAVATPVLALLLSTLFENFAWSALTVLGISMVIAGNLVMLTEPSRWLLWLRIKSA